MANRKQQLRETGGCSCHINPPCGFCTLLDEDEVEAYQNGGMKALEKLWDDMSDEEANVTGEELQELNCKAKEQNDACGQSSESDA